MHVATQATLMTIPTAARRRGIAAMLDPDAGLAFVEVRSSRTLPVARILLLLAVLLAVAMTGLPPLNSYLMLLLALGMVLFHLTAMEAAS